MDATQEQPAPPKKKSKALIIIRAFVIILILLAIGLGIWYYFENAKEYPSTDDAYVHAHVLYVAPQVSGQVQNVYIKNMQKVHKGQLLYVIKPHDFIAAENQAKAELILANRNVQASHAAIKVAEANVKERAANLEDIRGNTRRTLDLVKKNFASKQDGLNAKTSLENAKAAVTHAKTALSQSIVNAGKEGKLNAQVLQAQAKLNQAKLNLSYTKIYSPAEGTIINFRLRPNSWVTQGRANFSVIEHNSWWIDANYKETYLSFIKVGMPATIRIDMYPSKSFKGYVGNISRGSGAAFSLLPPENATGNWVKVTRRFPIRIYFLNSGQDDLLRVGASAVVTINTNEILKDHETPHAE
jgi:membrane fusion protein (multidrug efflux system)